MEKTRYTREELQEFKALILEKLAKAEKEYKTLKKGIEKNNESSMAQGDQLLEHSSSVAEREQSNFLAARVYKFIEHLKAALLRIDRGSYGICIKTGKLIPKVRLLVVPHTNHSVEGKMKGKGYSSEGQ